jgi:Mg2+ and Co2+ transporter CorA
VNNNIETEIDNLQKELVEISNDSKKLFTNKKELRKEYLSVLNQMENKKYRLKMLNKNRNSSET